MYRKRKLSESERRVQGRKLKEIIEGQNVRGPNVHITVTRYTAG
jgi:hypothetical protein